MEATFLRCLFGTEYANNAFGETNVHLFVIHINHREYGLQPERERKKETKIMLSG